MADYSFIGLDLTSSPKRPSACIGLDRHLDLAFTGYLGTNADLAGFFMSQSPCIIAIDAPLTLPKGLCCLEESCGCRPGQGGVRECERRLASLGIPCYFTTKKSIIKGMAYRAIELKGELENRGCEVVEVYPYASKVRLWGTPIPLKSGPEGLAFLRNHLADLIPSLSPYILDFSHHLCDAAIAAYTAYLYHHNEAEQIGNPTEGTIVIPRGILPHPEREILQGT
jgi:predicted nuclease with RNAse H fold